AQQWVAERARVLLSPAAIDDAVLRHRLEPDLRCFSRWPGPSRVEGRRAAATSPSFALARGTPRFVERRTAAVLRIHAVPRRDLRAEPLDLEIRGRPAAEERQIRRRAQRIGVV